MQSRGRFTLILGYELYSLFKALLYYDCDVEQQ